MAQSAARIAGPGRIEPSATLDSFMLPLAACAFALIVEPLILYYVTEGGRALKAGLDARPETRIFWPAMAAMTIIMLARHRSRLTKIPTNLVWFFAYLALAGTSVIWAYKPEASFVRFLQQFMVSVSVIVPALMASRTSDLMRALFWCFAISGVLNFAFAMTGTQTLADGVVIGNPGYMLGKNYLGECSGIAFLLSLHEVRYRGARRWIGLLMTGVAVANLILANSKTAMALSFLAPALAVFFMALWKWKRISPPLVIFSVVAVYLVVSTISSFNVYRISYILYHDSTFTGRQSIWNFALSEIDARPLLGWGYQSFWLVGPDAPSVVEAPGFVKNMPNAHNGYIDAMLELGWVGFVLLLTFLSTTLHACGRIVDRSPGRGLLLLSLFIYIAISNGLESTLVRGYEFLWITFLFVAAEIGRHGQAVPATARAGQSGPKGARPGRIGPPSRAAGHIPRRPRLVPTSQATMRP